jgi:hypothetical protein
MEIRKSHIIGSIVAAAALMAGIAGAQTLDQTVTDALSKDGAVMSQVTSQKQSAVIATQDMIMAQHGHPGGGHTGGDRGGQRGGDRGGDGRGGDGRGHEGHDDGHGGHVGGGHGGHNDGRDHHGRYGWGWDAWGRREWLGWIVWNGIGSCRGWYGERRAFCYADCRAELNSGLDNGADYQLCMQSCDYQYNTIWAPYWGACRL